VIADDMECTMNAKTPRKNAKKRRQSDSIFSNLLGAFSWHPWRLGVHFSLHAQREHFYRMRFLAD
jgi:hypothetical protein